MPRFRLLAAAPAPQPTPLPLDVVRTVLSAVMQPGHFFVAPPARLEWVHAVREEIPWEILHGRLLDTPFSRRQRSFEAWNVFLHEDGVPSTLPVLSLKLDAAAGQVHVTRAIHCHAWEGYNAGGNVYLSRETRRWVPELVGTLSLDRFSSSEDLADELACRLFQAVVGTSRLPLTSVEAPLPGYSLGQLAYFYRPSTLSEGPMTSWRDLVGLTELVELTWAEKARLLETLLHATPLPELGEMADRAFHRPTPGDTSYPVLPLLLTVFNEVSLSPFTDLVEKTLALLRVLEEHGLLEAADSVDFLSRLLRRLGRHLTAYDLVTFHHRGANYPDALLLDALLKDYLARVTRQPDLLTDSTDAGEDERRQKRLCRRALRQAWLLRSLYEGHRVPEAPTSQGENLRVLPAPHVRVPEEQILQPRLRPRRLFADDPLSGYLHGTVADLLRLALDDLHEPLELRELGMALFLDRPFGAAGKQPVEPDATLLFSYECFSRSLAERRLQLLAKATGLLSAAALEEQGQRLREDLSVSGLSLASVVSTARPGAAALADARQAAPDFVVLRTTSRSVYDFLSLYDVTPLWGRFSMAYLSPQRRVLLLGSSTAPGQGKLTVHDAELRPRLELTFDASMGYESCGGVEYPVDGLHVERVWDDAPGDPLHEHDVRGEGLVLHVRP